MKPASKQSGLLTLYDYWRSSSSFRVRLALEAKKITYNKVSVSLLDDSTDRPEFRALNPIGQVPVLEIRDDAGQPRRLIESMAILEYLEETYPQPALLPHASTDRAQVRALCELINSGTQPFQNPTVTERFAESERQPWTQYFIRRGLVAFEAQSRLTRGAYCFGDQITLADCVLAPQVFSSERFGVDVRSEFPALFSIFERIQQLPYYAAAVPVAPSPTKADGKH